MRQIEIEWRHYEKDGHTCDRCSTTGKTLTEVVLDLQREFLSQEMGVNLKEIILPESRIDESNMILINGSPLEEILQSTASSSSCSSCSCLTGKDTHCRTMVHAGVDYEAIPEELIREAVFLSLGIKT